MLRKILHIIVMVWMMVLTGTSSTVSAQSSPYKFDFGASVGMSGYLGDANTSSILKHPGLAVDLNSRYIVNSRIAFRAMLSAVTLSGNSADMTNVLPGGVTYKFNSSLFDLGARAEFNFFSYGIGETYKRMKKLSPYITLGMGVCVAHCGDTTVGAPTLPMGVGVKYKLNKRLNFGMEFTMTKTFSDKIDGEILNDLTGIKTSFVKNTDWFSRLTIGFTYEFGERCETCHYVD